MSERITADQLRRQRAAPAKGKGRVRGTQRVTIGGERFDSKREARRWQALVILQTRGEIADLRRQVPFDLHGQSGPILTPTGRVMRYVADFVYREVSTGAQVVEDAKGHPTDTFKMKRAVLAAQGIEVVTV